MCIVGTICSSCFAQCLGLDTHSTPRASSEPGNDLAPLHKTKIILCDGFGPTFGSHVVTSGMWSTRVEQQPSPQAFMMWDVEAQSLITTHCWHRHRSPPRCPMRHLRIKLTQHQPSRPRSCQAAHWARSRQASPRQSDPASATPTDFRRCRIKMADYNHPTWFRPRRTNGNNAESDTTPNALRVPSVHSPIPMPCPLLPKTPFPPSVYPLRRPLVALALRDEAVSQILTEVFLLQDKSSHDGAGTAAAGLLLLPLHLQFRLRPARRLPRRAGGIRRHVPVVAAYLANDFVKGIVDVDARFRRRLDEFAAKAARHRLALFGRKSAVGRLCMHGRAIVNKTNRLVKPASPPPNRTCCRRGLWESSPCP